MKKASNVKYLILMLIFVVLISPQIIAQEVSQSKAIDIAKDVVGLQFPNEWGGNPANIDIRRGLKTDLPFYICDIDNRGFVLVSRNSECPGVLGYSYESKFPTDLSGIPESFKAYLGAIKKSFDAYSKEAGTLETDIDQGEKFMETSPSLKSDFIAPLMTTKWKADSSFCKHFPEGSILVSSAVIAMGQVFRYFEKPASGFGEFCYLYGPRQEEICTDFGYMFDYSDMPDLEASEETQMLLKFMAFAGRVQYSGANLLTYRETLPTHFFYSDNMRAVEYWEHDITKVLLHQLKMGRPVPAEWKGHDFVIDGYYDTDFFHFNFGLGGELDGFYLLDFPNVTTDEDHFLLKCFVNYHPKSYMPVPTNLGIVTAGDSLNISWNIEIPDSLTSSFDRYILLRDGVVPVIETTSTSVMIHPADLGVSSEINCIAVFNTYGSSELSEPYKYISDYTLADIPSLELRQEINIQLGYEEDLNRIPYLGELELVKKLKIDFADQRGIDQLTQLKFLQIDGLTIPGIEPGEYLSSLNYLLFHRCRQFDHTVFENTNSLTVIHGSDGLPYDMYDLRHNSDASVITLATHDGIINNMGDLYGIDKYYPDLTFFDLYHMDLLAYGKCYISYESFNDILPKIIGENKAYEHVSPSSFVPCYPEPVRNSNVPNTNRVGWQSNFNNAQDVFYNIFIGESRSNMALIAPFYSDNVYDYNFENNKDYYWRVEAFHGDTTYYSGIYHFSTYETMPMPFVEGFDDYYEKCDVAYESPYWINFGDVLPTPTALSRDKKRSGRYALEVLPDSDVGVLFEPQKDSAYQVEFYFQNNMTEFAIEFLQESIDGDTLAVNSKIGLFGNNLGTFSDGVSSEQFLFTPSEWNFAQITLDNSSGMGVLSINESEIARWNWNVQLNGSDNTNPFRGIRFADTGSSGSGLIDDLQVAYTESTGIKEIQNSDLELSYSPLSHELIISNGSEITGLEIFDLRGRKITTFACHGEHRLKLEDSIPNGVYILMVKHRDGRILTEKISIRR